MVPGKRRFPPGDKDERYRVRGLPQLATVSAGDVGLRERAEQLRCPEDHVDFRCLLLAGWRP